MKTSGVCPNCGGVLTFWTYFKEPFPNFIKCPHCKNRNHVRFKGMWPVFSIACIGFFALGGYDGYVFVEHGWRAGLAGLAVLMLAWLLLEFVLITWAYTTGEIRISEYD